mmetsp:Transcript_4800/g.16923  ORF Transcript_4800/g.16923 Transcript_4800/m.16923 type:complete len:202 (+) Transcript_4800:975-1580(+)
MWSPTRTLLPSLIIWRATTTCGSGVSFEYCSGGRERDLVITNWSSSTSRMCSRFSRRYSWICVTTSSRPLPERMKSSTRVPISFERGHQSRRTRSRPFISRSTLPSAWSMRAAYFFLFSSSIVLKMPSSSNSRSSYLPLIVFFTVSASSLATSTSCVHELIMMLSVSPYTTVRPSSFSAMSFERDSASRPFLVISSAIGMA